MSIKEEIKFATLLGLVQKRIFCPKCSHILDVASAVEVSAYVADELALCDVVCSSCWDKSGSELREKASKIGDNVRIEHVDGREMDV